MAPGLIIEYHDQTKINRSVLEKEDASGSLLLKGYESQVLSVK